MKQHEIGEAARLLQDYLEHVQTQALQTQEDKDPVVVLYRQRTYRVVDGHLAASRTVTPHAQAL